MEQKCWQLVKLLCMPALACVVMAYSRKVYFLIPEYGGEVRTCLVDNISLWLAISSCVNMWLASVNKISSDVDPEEGWHAKFESLFSPKVKISYSFINNTSVHKKQCVGFESARWMHTKAEFIYC